MKEDTKSKQGLSITTSIIFLAIGGSLLLLTIAAFSDAFSALFSKLNITKSIYYRFLYAFFLLLITIIIVLILVAIFNKNLSHISIPPGTVKKSLIVK